MLSQWLADSLVKTRPSLCTQCPRPHHHHHQISSPKLLSYLNLNVMYQYLICALMSSLSGMAKWGEDGAVLSRVLQSPS